MHLIIPNEVWWTHQGGEMKWIPICIRKKKYSLGTKWCAFMQMSVLNKNIPFVLGGAAWSREQGTPWGPDDDETPLLLCRLDI